MAGKGSAATAGAAAHGGEDSSGGKRALGGEGGEAGQRGPSGGTGGKTNAAGVGGEAGEPDSGDSGGESSGLGATGGSSAGGAGKSSGGKSSGGASGKGGGTAGHTASCGALGESCCAADGCDEGLSCLASVSCSCAETLGGQYVVRVDGSVLVPETADWIRNADTSAPLTHMTTVAEGLSHACSADDAGSVFCWQKDASGNGVGQLGNGTKTDTGLINRATQVLVAANTPLTGVTGLADYCLDHYSSTDATCAVTGAGKLYCWGNLSYLVNGGTTLTSAYAELITTDGLNPLTGVLQATIGEGRSACAVVAGSAGNEVWCWGQNGSYNLGQGDATLRQYPTKVTGLTAPTKVVIAADDNGGVGPTTTCAIDGGNVRCWGYNGGNGDAGVNSATATVTTPTLVKLSSGATLDDIVDLEGEGDPGYGNGGGGNFCALRSDGTIWCWGRFYHPYASNYGITNIVSVGNVFDTPRYLTSDGVYHVGSGKTESVNCGALE